jgi:hypothetical protein
MYIIDVFIYLISFLLEKSSERPDFIELQTKLDNYFTTVKKEIEKEKQKQTKEKKNEQTQTSNATSNELKISTGSEIGKDLIFICFICFVLFYSMLFLFIYFCFMLFYSFHYFS